MSRVKTGPHRRRKHKKVLERTKGMRLARGVRYKVSKEADLHAGMHAYIGRKLRKRDMRPLWIIRINAALSQTEGNPSYSVFIKLLKDANIELDRKMLAHLAATDSSAFQSIVNTVAH